LFGLVLLLGGCGGEPTPPSIAGVLPEAGVVPGWSPRDDPELFDRENLFDLVDGQADAFFAYGFERVAVRRYENADGTLLDIEVWELATPADAFGLFSASIAGTPASVGNDGDADPGRRLAFWQDRFCVQVRARKPVPDGEIQAFAQAVSSRLPAGGERPALLQRLPPGGRVERSERFFHQEISIQNALWLGGENLLGLGPETDGVLALYEADRGTATLLIVQYHDATAAVTGREALRAGGSFELAGAEARDNLLGAVFGPWDEAAAGSLLAEALGDSD
jgi:hypothetical protein